MSVIPPQLDPAPRIHPRERPPTAAPWWRDTATLAWPIGLVVLIAAIGMWRGADGADRSASSSAAAAAAPVVAARAFGDLRLDVPREWTTLDRGDGRITWGTAGRTHTVTLASTEAATLPLATVVRAVARESITALPSTRLVDGPTTVDPPEPMRRGDSLVIARFEVVEGARTLQVVQAWRRDARASRDVVATWTSTDGTWPVEPRDAVPSVSGGS